MNIYALFPLLATLAYIPLLVTTMSSRPWRQQRRLFFVFLLSAMTWSLADYFFRSNLFPQSNLLLLKIILAAYVWMAVQYHCFLSSFFSPGQGRWLPFAFGSLAVATWAIALGYLPEGVSGTNGKLYPEYGGGIIFVAVPLAVLGGRDVFVFLKKLRGLANPIIYNQTISLLFGITTVIIFTVAALLPFGREFPISHFGNIINAFILSYATIRHQLVDIRFVLRRGLAWLILGVMGAASYGLLLAILHNVVLFSLDMNTILIVTGVSVLVIALVYRLRGLLFATMGKAFQGESYDYRQKLSDFANKIHNLFSLREQGGELLSLVTKAIVCRRAGLLFQNAAGSSFVTQLVEPKGDDNPLYGLRMEGDSPIVEYLRREQKLLTRETLSILPEFRALWEEEKERFRANEIELFIPLVSRDRLVAILVVDKRQSGRYTLEDLHLLEEVSNRVAVSMEKEFLREQLKESQEELSIINRLSTIITSSLDIQAIYDSFIEELKKAVDASWAAICLIEEDELRFLAVSSEIGSTWQAGERIPVKNTATEWIVAYKKAVVEDDLAKESRFANGKHHLRQGVRSIAYLPLIAKGEAIGSLIVASRQANAYSLRHIKLLEQLASQIAMPIENSRLYAKAEQEARIDSLTGLLNRRSLATSLTSEISRHSRYGGVFSLIILDLDSFKLFNDNYGHLVGDKLLRQAGSVLKESIRGADQAFRYGGDEFAVLLPQTSLEATQEVAERIRKHFAAKLGIGGITTTTSIGLASWPVDGIGLNELIASADAALYQSKRNGGNQVRHASIGLSSVEENMTITDDEDNNALTTIYSLAASVDARDGHSHSHSKRVTRYALALGQLLDLDPETIAKVKACALLHDIGKIGVSDEILNKKEELTSAEWKTIKVHPQLGATIVRRVPQLAQCAPGILHHHERYDGSGYPMGLKGEEIPLEARILAIADAFAAMTSERSYSSALSHDEALEEIKAGAGRQFDPQLAEAFLAIAKSSLLPPGEILDMEMYHG